MTLRSKALIVLALAEATYSVDAEPTGDNAIVTSNAALTPLNATLVSRNLDRATFGNDQQMHVGLNNQLTFNVELVGSGTLGVAPAWGPLLKACGVKEVVTEDTSVVYTPDTSSTESLTLYFFMDGQLHKLLGARGTFQIQANSLTIPVIQFTFTGLYVDPASTDAPAALGGWDDFQIPDPVTFDNTPTASLDGLASVFKSFTLDNNGTVTFFENPGERQVAITDRQSQGSIEILAPALSDKNYFTQVAANTLVPLAFEHGTDDTRRVAIHAPQVQILQPQYGDDTGRATLQAQLAFVPTSAGDDEWELRLEAA